MVPYVYVRYNICRLRETEIFLKKSYNSFHFRVLNSTTPVHVINVLKNYALFWNFLLIKGFFEKVS